ncbi:TetR/AcrR family transcriptional regulator [Brevibacterium otitidis]|uniref:TetR/AcrR family transcriptional regulator n=1 Tax=Brevibacterium otitidis TaxID=53364 RepID=A0ABV5X2G9_9MICO|nr:hypothetical protein GCM10023233_10500 [Brevibacterium otitidis]
MPKIVDQSQRRAAIIEACWQVIAESGLSAASVRAVAARAQMSPSALRHWFSSQAELHAAALTELSDRPVKRIRKAAQRQMSGRDLARLVLAELLPLDEARTLECTVWYAFLLDPALPTELEAITRRFWHQELWAARMAVALLRGSDVPPDDQTALSGSDEQTAHLMRSAIDGLAVEGVVFGADAQVSTRLDELLDLLSPAS